MSHPFDHVLVAEQKRHTLLLAVLAAVAVSALLVIAFSRDW